MISLVQHWLPDVLELLRSPAGALLFTLVLPVAFLTTVPAQVLLGEAAVPMLLAGLALAVLFFAAARAFWLFALRFYTSASS